jgi:hypothetical protein
MTEVNFLVKKGLTVPKGSATTPAIIFDAGDTNTGIYSPGADQVAISTAGSGRLFIDASGKVEVSTATGSSSITPTELRISSTTDANDWNTTNPWARLGFYSADTTNGARTRAAIDVVQQFTNGNVSAFSFKTDNGSGTLVERQRITYTGTTTLTSAAATDPLIVKIDASEVVRIDSSGRLGVGTTSPGSLLECYGTGVSTAATVNGTGRYRGFEIYASGTRTAYFNDDSTGNIASLWTTRGNLVLGTGDTERVRIDSSGRVGIGTSSPNSKLSVIDGAVECNQFFYNAISSSLATASRGLLFNIDGTSYGRVYSPNGKSVAIQAGIGTLTDAVTVDQSGNVGIGTTTPTTLLEIKSDGTAANEARLTINEKYNASDTGFGVDFKRTYDTGGDAQDAGYIRMLRAGGNTNGGLTFGVGDRGAVSERLRIDSSGRLLVGTSSSSNLYAIGGANFAPKVQIQGTDPIELGVQRTDGPPYVHIANGQSGLASGNDVGFISFNGKDSNNLLVQAAQISAAVDGTPGANDMPGRLVFSTTADGASSPTERMRISSDGNVNVGGGGITARVAAASAATSTVVFYGYANTASYTNTVIQAQSETSAGTGWNLYIGYASNGNLVYRVYGNGNVQNTNNSYGAISDIKLKENIVDANSQWNDLKALQVRNYNLKEGETHTQIGLIAQEAELVSPGLVSESPDRDEDGNDLGTVTKSVNYSVLYMKAVKALQEAMERIETLEAEVAALKVQ